MMAPPLTNLLAVWCESPGELREIEEKIRSSAEFAQVWRPAPSWVAGCAPLPGSAPDDAAVRARGLAFVEGRDRVMRAFAQGQPHALDRLLGLADDRPDRLSELPGDFGFVRFRPDGGATVVRSCAGLVPLYLAASKIGFAVATRLGDFVRYLPDEPRADALVNAVWTTGHAFFPDRRTFLAGATIVEAGSFVRIERGREIMSGRYWSPRPPRLARPTPDGVREHVDRLRTLLVTKLSEDLDPAGGNLLTLSGGVDSGALAALATRVVGRQVWTLSIVPDDDDLRARELSYIEPLKTELGIDRSWSIRARADALIDLMHAAPPIVFHVIHPALCALPRIARQAPVRVLFGGEFADEVCGSAHTIPDWAAATSWIRLARDVRSRPDRGLKAWLRDRAGKVIVRPALPFPQDLPLFVNPFVRSEYREWLDRRRRAAAADRAPHAYLWQRTQENDWVAMNWEAASALGIRRSLPFLHREVLELAFACHPCELIGPGNKRLLRAALRDDVPPRSLNRPDKGGWGRTLKGVRLPWTTKLPAALEPIVCPTWFPTPPALVDRSHARGLTQLVLFDAAVSCRRPTASVAAGGF